MRPALPTGALALLALVVTTAAVLEGRLPADGRRGTHRWHRTPRRVATRRDLAPLRLRRRRGPMSDPVAKRWIGPRGAARLAAGAPRAAGPTTERLVLGRVGRSTIACEPGHSVLVVGPTQSGKTTGVVVPALRSWKGPVVVTSVKPDVVRSTLAVRQALGPVAVFDPVDATGLASATWSPVSAATSWPAARRIATALVEATGAVGGLTDGEFWYALAAKLLAALLHAAALRNSSLADVLGWVESGEVIEAIEVLERHRAEGALRALAASLGREERQRSSVFSTAEHVLDQFALPSADPRDAPLEATLDRLPARRPLVRPRLEIDALVAGLTTLYVCAPAHHQRRMRGLFSALVGEVLEAAFQRSVRAGRPLDPPLLVLVDEAANVAPVPELDTIASTAAAHGIQLVTVWQDLSQLEVRYGRRALSVANNHRAKLFLPGIADRHTLEYVAQVCGEVPVYRRSWTTERAGGRSVTEAEHDVPLMAPAALRCLGPGEALLVYGNLPPARLTLPGPPAAGGRRRLARLTRGFRVRRAARAARAPPRALGRAGAARRGGARSPACRPAGCRRGR
jgi:type IV secretion system protein VirD4